MRIFLRSSASTRRAISSGVVVTKGGSFGRLRFGCYTQPAHHTILIMVNPECCHWRHAREAYQGCFFGAFEDHKHTVGGAALPASAAFKVLHFHLDGHLHARVVRCVQSRSTQILHVSPKQQHSDQSHRSRTCSHNRAQDDQLAKLDAVLKLEPINGCCHARSESQAPHKRHQR